MEHPFQSEWMLWAHLPHDTVWTLASYTPLMKTAYAEELIALPQHLLEHIHVLLVHGSGQGLQEAYLQWVDVLEVPTCPRRLGDSGSFEEVTLSCRLPLMV